MPQQFASRKNPKVYLNNLNFVQQIIATRTLQGGQTEQNRHEAVIAVLQTLGIDITYYRIRITPEVYPHLSGLEFLESTAGQRELGEGPPADLLIKSTEK